MRYRPDLDGIRALAVLAVLASHTGQSIAQGGWMGVDVFFVLSGFLITSLLMSEHATTGRIRIGAFYARRALRLYPALLLLLLSGTFFYRQLGDGGTLAGYGKTAALAGLYLEDIAYGLFNRPFGGLGHTWSLGVEEQFYLLWPPLLIWLLARGRDPLRWAAAGTVISWSIMIGLDRVSPDGVPDAAYLLPWSRFSQLLAGCCVAVLVHRNTFPSLVRRPVFGWFAASTGIALVGLAAESGRYPNIAWEAPAIAIATGALIWHLTAGTATLRRGLSSKPLPWIGRRSYGIYLYHLPILDILDAHMHTSRTRLTLTMIAVTFVVAEVSYRFVEMPFLRIKQRLRPPSEIALQPDA